MSHYPEEPFKISRGDQGGWVVDFGGTPVPVGCVEDAMLLADLPIELYAAVSTEHKPDLNKIRRILVLCDEYHLDSRFAAVRELRLRFKRTEASKA